MQWSRPISGIIRDFDCLAVYFLTAFVFFSGSTDQSQATEMLQEILANDKDATWQPAEAHDSAFKPQATHSNGFSSDASPSQNANSLPQYHFYGLAATQTQSQLHDDDVDMHEGFQKENIGATERNKNLGRPPSPHAPPPKNAPSKTLQVDSRNGSPSTTKVHLDCSHQTYGYEATQILDEPGYHAQPNVALDADGNASGYESSEPTSSFGRLLDGIHDPEESDVQPTQPSTQPGHSHMLNPTSGPFNGGWNPTVATSTATTSYPQSAGPRSLVSLVRPENQWRYQKYQQPKQVMPSIHDYQSHSKGGNVSSFGQETQPSHPIQDRPYLASNVSSNSHHGRNRPPTLGLPLGSPVGDAMDIVPDSEPLASDQRNGLSKIFSATKYNSNANNEACQDAAMGENESEYTRLEDKGDEMDDDDDVPLAVSRKQSKGKAGPKVVDQKGKAPQKTIHAAPSARQNVKVR